MSCGGMVIETYFSGIENKNPDENQQGFTAVSDKKSFKAPRG